MRFIIVILSLALSWVDKVCSLSSTSRNIAPNLGTDMSSVKPTLSVPVLANYDIECILSDVDGTLLRSDHKLSKRTIDTIAAVINRGYMFFPCTGRTRKSMAAAAPDMLEVFGRLHRTPGVYQQGLMVYGPDGNLIYERCLPDDVIERTVDFCDKHSIAVIAYAGEAIYCRSRCEQTNKITIYSEPLPEIFPRGLDHLQRSGVPVHKLIVLDEEDVLLKLRPLLADALGDSASLTRAVPGMLEVLPPGSSKGEGVKILLDHIGMPADNVMAFGDGENDIEMLSLVKLGVAVSNGKPILKQAADALTLSNDEDGVAHSLDMLMELGRWRL
jgi:Cof subfamily protein (haloacid dehalogenase superfamily)